MPNGTTPKTVFSGLRWLAGIAAIAVGLQGYDASAHVRDRSLQDMPVPRLSPVSKRLSSFAKAAESGDKRAIANARKLGLEPTAIQLLTWKWLLSGHRSVTFDDISGFLNNGGDSWPRAERLQRRAEEFLLLEQNDQLVLAWFANHTPVSGRGRLRYAEALLNSGDQVKGKEMILAAWMTGRFSKSEQRELLKQHGKRLSSADHLQRIDSLVWNGRTAEAARMMHLVPKDYQALMKARIALRRSQGGVDAAIKRVPAHLQNDPGLIYERVLWRRKKGRHDGARELLLASDAPDLQQKRWWKERRLQARKMLTAKRYEDAYALSRKHGLDRGVSFAEGEFMAGWIALQFRNAAHLGRDHFLSLEQGVNYPVSKSRAWYWAGRANEQLLHRDEARVQYGEASSHQLTFYGQLAMAKNGGLLQAITPTTLSITDKMRQHVFADSRARAAILLGQLGETSNLRAMLYRMQRDATTKEAHALLVELGQKAAGASMGVTMAKRAYHRGVTLPEESYPLIHQSASGRVAPELQLALTRQESQFDTRATSRVGARGLMQLMPATAKQVAKWEKLPYSTTRLLTDPDYNVQLGTAYLQRLVQKYNGSWALALAAYNAGEGRVRRWRRDHGDPLAGDISMIDWIELIPFTETRNYVQRIMETTQVYRLRLNPASQGTSLVSIEQDLLRGTAAGIGLVQ